MAVCGPVSHSYTAALALEVTPETADLPVTSHPLPGVLAQAAAAAAGL